MLAEARHDIGNTVFPRGKGKPCLVFVEIVLATNWFSKNVSKRVARLFGVSCSLKHSMRHVSTTR